MLRSNKLFALYFALPPFLEPRKPTNANLDVLFLVDSSSDVSRENFQLEKQFVTSIARSLNVSPGKSRGALITYGQNPRISFRFDSNRNTAEFDRLVGLARYMGGARRIDRALGDAADVIRNSRPNVPKVVILLTAGRHTTDPGAKSLDEAAKPLRDLGAKTYVIAIGDSVNKPQLRPIIQRPEDIIPVDGFTKLRPLGPSIGREVAKGASKY